MLTINKKGDLINISETHANGMGIITLTFTNESGKEKEKVSFNLGDYENTYEFLLTNYYKKLKVTKNPTKLGDLNGVSVLVEYCKNSLFIIGKGILYTCLEREVSQRFPNLKIY